MRWGRIRNWPRALRDTILGQEISMLPAAVAQNQGLIIQLMERQVELANAVNTALDAVVSAMSQAGENTAVALEAHGRRIEGVESALAELREEGHRTRESLGQVLSGVKQLQTDMTETRADVKQLQTDVAETKADVKQLQSDMAETKLTSSSSGQTWLKPKLTSSSSGQTWLKPKLTSSKFSPM